jgi:hypothetical protein
MRALRSGWETGHAIRFTLQLIALAQVTLSVLSEVREGSDHSKATWSG